MRRPYVVEQLAGKLEGSVGSGRAVNVAFVLALRSPTAYGSQHRWRFQLEHNLLAPAVVDVADVVEDGLPEHRQVRHRPGRAAKGE